VDTSQAYLINCLLHDARDAARQVQKERQRIGDLEGIGFWMQFGVFLELTAQRHNNRWNKDDRNWSS
jgi:hypothetical protein